jgi:hypothetical protein
MLTLSELVSVYTKYTLEQRMCTPDLFSFRKFKNATEESEDTNIFIQILDTFLCSWDTKIGNGYKIECTFSVHLDSFGLRIKNFKTYSYVKN